MQVMIPAKTAFGSWVSRCIWPLPPSFTLSPAGDSSSLTAKRSCMFLVGISLTLRILHKWFANLLYNHQPGGPRCILQSGLYPTDMFSSAGPSRSTRLSLKVLTSVWPLPHRHVQLSWTFQEYKIVTDIAQGSLRHASHHTTSRYMHQIVVLMLGKHNTLTSYCSRI